MIQIFVFFSNSGCGCTARQQQLLPRVRRRLLGRLVRPQGGRQPRGLRRRELRILFGAEENGRMGRTASYSGSINVHIEMANIFCFPEVLASSQI